MDRLSTLQLLIRIVELGSFTRAAQEGGLGQPAVSKQVAALEARLGVRLLERTSRGLKPTAAGLDLYHSAVRLIADLEETESRIRSGSSGPAGLVRVATPPALGRMYIIPRLPDFVAQFPAIAVEFSVAQRTVDLVQEGIDVALRVGPLKTSNLIARRIGSMEMLTVATEGYLAARGVPHHPHHLDGHSLIAGHTGGAIHDWQFRNEGAALTVTPAGALRSDDGEDLRAAVLAGLGILHGPSALLRADVDAGRVVQVLEQFTPEAVPINLVSTGGRKMAQRVRVFMDFLAATFATDPGLASR
ncbi:transcriptional regulator, LysR family [Sphingobium sp. YR657]|uniref:LysR family transcriptional regulator n=1 Tax=Sphingobium sp. YR657 TaxID=1884366 RepID=UPI00091E561F|nr:LysR family transcriptional regulator [Sphingobium sp. YR657]SHM46012.1 transcriptional regulator, LysR family [Sphingobium sp. YR657]